MQSCEDIDAHRHAGDEMPLQPLRRGLAVFRRFGDGGEQRGFNEAEIQLGDALRHPDVRVVRGTRMRRRFTGLQSDIQGNGLVFGATHISWLLVGQTRG